jgi:beta-catenin-like protein 1
MYHIINEEAAPSQVEKKLDSNAIERLLEEAEESGISTLDAVTLKQLLVAFERKINKNQMLRVKYSDQPEKFMESEIELNQEINELYPLAASPELYPVFIQSGSLTSVLGMITHENTDISITTIGLIQELTDPEVLRETEEAITLVDALLQEQV